MTRAYQFHEGEVYVQERCGERASAVINSRNISAAIPVAAKAFVSQQVWCAVSATDEYGEVWSSLLVGDKGFLSPDEDMSGLSVLPTSFQTALKSIRPSFMLTAGKSVGMLLLETSTRRRLRVNGVVTDVHPDGFHLAVEESFPACPKYIQRRQPVSSGAGVTLPESRELVLPNEEIAELLKETDTLFMGSIGPNGRMDVSHRGGRLGFASMRGEAIWIPDFNGNSMFNTLGNLHLDPRCSLVIPDFANGRQVQLSGRAKLHFDVPEQAELTGGSMRWIEFETHEGGVSIATLPLDWTFIDSSPFNP